jgi:hypothetical protein
MGVNMESLKDVGKHDGTWGNGHYEATVYDDGKVIIKTILDDANHTYTVSLTAGEWNRLATWVKWASGEWK